MPYSAKSRTWSAVAGRKEKLTMCSFMKLSERQEQRKHEWQPQWPTLRLTRTVPNGVRNLHAGHTALPVVHV